MKTINQNKCLVFLEFLDEARLFLDSYLNEIRLDPDRFRIVSFHPLVKSYLLKLGIVSTDSFHHCPTTSHQRLLTVLEKYTEQVRRGCRLRDSLGIEESYIENLLYYLRVILSHWLYQVEVICNAIEYYQPEMIIAVEPKKPAIAQSPSIEFNERYIADIVTHICSRKKITLRKLLIKIVSINFKSKAAKWLKKILSLMLYTFLQKTVKTKQNLLIAPAIDFGMGTVLKELKSELGDDYSFAVMNLPYKKAIQSIFRNNLRNGGAEYSYLPCPVWKRVSFDHAFVEEKNRLCEKLYNLIDEWNYRDVSPATWLKRKYRFALEPEVIDATYSFAVNLNKYLDKWKPVLVLAQHSRMISAVLGELCKLKQIPSLMIPHGSFTPVSDEYSGKEWRENALGLINTPYRYVAIQTPMAKKFLLDVPTRSEPIITGPLLFGRKVGSDNVMQLRKQYAGNGDKIILHAGTPKQRQSARLLNYETVNEYVDGLISLVNTINRLKGVCLIIRFRPFEGLRAEELRGLLPVSNSCFVATEGEFADYLSIADLLISYSSTTIEDALQNYVPVLLFNKYSRYQHIKGTILSPKSTEILPSPIYNVNSEEDLLFGIKWILSNHLSSKVSLSVSFGKYKYRADETIKLSRFIQDILRNDCISKRRVQVIGVMEEDDFRMAEKPIDRRE